MKIFLTGSAGQLGRALQSRCPEDVQLCCSMHADLDIGDAESVHAALAGTQPDVIVNAAAYTDVDAAEDNVDLAERVNAYGAGLLADAAERIGARLIHLSTDYVFGGHATQPYTPQCETYPRSVYGSTKLEGERRVHESLGERAIVLRSAWLYSALPGNFVTRMLELMAEKDELRVVDDQIGSPTWAPALAATIFALARRPDVHGLYHWADKGVASRYEWACAIQNVAVERQLLDKRIPIVPVKSAEYETRAQRPPFSALDSTATERVLGIEAALWRDNLRTMFDREAAS